MPPAWPEVLTALVSVPSFFPRYFDSLYDQNEPKPRKQGYKTPQTPINSSFTPRCVDRPPKKLCLVLLSIVEERV